MARCPFPALLALLLAADATAGGGLFGRRLRVSEEPPRREAAPSESAEAKPSRDEPDDPFASPKPARPAKPVDEGEGRGKPGEDVPVRIRPIELAKADKDLPVDIRMDFRLSRIDRPLSPETSALFREGWEAFRRQHARVDGAFERLPGAPLPISLTLRQDLGESRWLADAAWTNTGALAWCPQGPNRAQVIVVLDASGRPGERREVSALRIGLVEASFTATIPPAEGLRVRLRRQAFVETAPLADDEPTRQAFQEAVAAGKALRAIVTQVRDCRACGGVGYIRRRIPGKIQDARDPCPGNCERGEREVGLELTFRP
jgi:hypothetical protein